MLNSPLEPARAARLLLIAARMAKPRALGDFEGHPFRGNQWTENLSDEEIQELVDKRNFLNAYALEGYPGAMEMIAEINKILDRTPYVKSRILRGLMHDHAAVVSKSRTFRGLMHDHAEVVSKSRTLRGPMQDRAEVVQDHVEAVPDTWFVGNKGLERHFSFENRRQMASFTAALMTHANEVNHHPDVCWDDHTVIVTYCTHSQDNAVTEKDHEGATKADALYGSALKVLGGPGSGNFGHAGRPGEVGGSGLPDYGHVTKHLPPTLEGVTRRAFAFNPTSGDLVVGREIAENVMMAHGEALNEAGITGWRLYDQFTLHGYLGEGQVNISSVADSDDESNLDLYSKLYKKFENVGVDTKKVNLTLRGGRPSPLTILKMLGGPGSGNFGHAGRPGEVGGSGLSISEERRQRARLHQSLKDLVLQARKHGVEPNDETKALLSELFPEVIEETPPPTLPIPRERRPYVAVLGGPGSGNFGHAGRPGHVGGSATEESDLNPQEQALSNAIVDFKLDRKLTGPGSQTIAEAIPGARFEHYVRVPGLDRMHEAMGIEPTPETEGKAYQAKRDALFNTLPEQQVPFEKLTYTQPRVNKEQYEGLSKHPEYFNKPVQVLKYGDRYYVMNGHHRVVAAYMAGQPTIAAKVFDASVKSESYRGPTLYDRRSQRAQSLVLRRKQRLYGRRDLGGPGSGNFGHAGRPGEVGGSSGTATGTNAKEAEAKKQQELADAQQHPLAHPPFVLGGASDHRAKVYVAAYGEEHKAAPLPDHIKPGEMRECYKNASLACVMNKDLDYAEGYAQNAKTGDIVFQHAWAVTKDGKVVDSTWDNPEQNKYFGVRYDREKYLKYLYKAKLYGVLGSTEKNVRKAIDTGGNGLRKVSRQLGDFGGHPFRGNQYTGGLASFQVDPSVPRAQQEKIHKALNFVEQSQAEHTSKIHLFVAPSGKGSTENPHGYTKRNIKIESGKPVRDEQGNLVYSGKYTVYISSKQPSTEDFVRTISHEFEHVAQWERGEEPHEAGARAIGGQTSRKFRGLGDKPGHPFYGNQWTDARGGNVESRPATKSEMKAATKADLERLKEVHGIAIPPSYKNVQVAIDDKVELLATAVGGTGKTASYYSKSYADNQQAAKWARLVELHDRLGSIQDRVNKDIKGSGSEHYHEAMTLRLIMQTGLRNGGEEGEGIGASSLRTEHATVEGNTVRLQFKAKGGVDQDLTVKDPVFAKYVRERQKAGEERLFPHTADTTLRYMKDTSGGAFKVHDLRTYVGTTLAQKMVNETIKEGKLPATKKDYKAFEKAIAKAVAGKLGNTPAIALKSYIHPAVLRPYRP